MREHWPSFLLELCVRRPFFTLAEVLSSASSRRARTYKSTITTAMGLFVCWDHSTYALKKLSTSQTEAPAGLAQSGGIHVLRSRAIIRSIRCKAMSNS